MSATATSLLAEVASIAVAPGSPTERAQMLLKPLLRVARVDAAFITLYDPERRRQVPLMRHGYTAAVNRHLDSPQLTDDLELAGMQRSRTAVRIEDLPVPVETLPTWSEHFYPAGIRECLGVSLFTFDGRYLGVMNSNSSDPRPASDAACVLLARMAPMIAHAVDPLRTISMTAGIVADAIAAVVVTRNGDTVKLPGLPLHALLAADSPTLAVATAHLTPEHVHVTFLCHRGDQGAGDRLFRVTALACAPQPPGHFRAVVLLSAPPDLRGLTPQELEVIGLLVAGWGKPRIAAVLEVTQSTVAGHISRIRAKLRASSPAAVAVRAKRQGLYIPAELLTGPEPTG